MKILVLGGYGLIGTAITRALLAAGHDVTGLGRSLRKGQSAAPDARWIAADISTLTSPDAWAPHIAGMDAVVNAAGLLQDGLKDDVARVQRDAICALISACGSEGVRNFIQVSAPGAHLSSDTEFFRTKAEADAALKASALNWAILRPGLVLSPQAYGGTSLVRRLAAFPLVQPVMLGDAKIQTVHVDDVAAAVVHALENDLSGVDVDLVEEEPHTLHEIILRIRQWLGFAPPIRSVPMPNFLGHLVGRVADVSGHLGWRSSLRTTSLRVLARGVTGNGARWPNISGLTVRSLDETLRALPSTLQERVHARVMLWFPLLLLALSAFWIASGVIGLVRRDAAMAILDDRLPAPWPQGAVIGGGLLDIAIGLALLVRPLVRPACIAAILVSLAYLAGAALLAPHLYADPLGPMVKVVPSIALAIVVAAMAEER